MSPIRDEAHRNPKVHDVTMFSQYAGEAMSAGGWRDSEVTHVYSSLLCRCV